MTNDWTKEKIEDWIETALDADAHGSWIRAPKYEIIEDVAERMAPRIEKLITEQRRRAKEEAVEYIKLHSPKLHATGGYEVKNEILHEATREGE